MPADKQEVGDETADGSPSECCWVIDLGIHGVHGIVRRCGVGGVLRLREVGGCVRGDACEGLGEAGTLVRIGPW